MSTTLKEVIQAAVTQAVTQAVADSKLAAHPVGSYYWSSESTDPSTLFGGTWEQVKDRFVLAAGDSYAVGATGGEATHTLAEAEMPAHSHIEFPGESTHYLTISPPSGDSFGGTGFGNGTGFNSLGNAGWWSDRYKKEQEDNLKGNSQPHNNMPPYIVAYCWKRTA